MKEIKIINWRDSSVIYTYKCKHNTIAKTVIKAILTGVDLSYATLDYATLHHVDLSYATLDYATLRHADLSCTTLRYATLRHADLSCTTLRYATLRHADLYSANLYSVNLNFADLTFANLNSANLNSANLKSTNLKSTNLESIKGINKYYTTPLYMLKDQIGKIRAYKLVNSQLEGNYKGGIVYKKGVTVEIKNANTDESKSCAKGINLATLDWCMKEWKEGYRILVVEFTAKDIAAIPINSDGKFRVFRCKVVGEKNLTELGLEDVK